MAPRKRGRRIHGGFAPAAGPLLVGGCLGGCWGSQSGRLGPCLFGFVGLLSCFVLVCLVGVVGLFFIVFSLLGKDPMLVFFFFFICFCNVVVVRRGQPTEARNKVVKLFLERRF